MNTHWQRFPRACSHDTSSSRDVSPSFMKTLNENQYHLIKADLPVQRGNVKIWNLPLINAGVYIAENGCKWPSLPEKFGHWHTIYTRAKRWAERGVLERLCIGLQKEKLIKMSITCLGLDSTSIKVHPDAAEALNKMDPTLPANHEADSPQKFIWFRQMMALD
jgi:transposase